MLTSINSVNPFPQLTSLSYNPSPYIIDHQTNDTFLHHYHNPLTVPLIPTNPPITETLLNMAASNNVMVSKQDIDLPNGDQYDFSDFLPGKRPVKKDRHSKIYTAQGLRDRRVRLSIEIARKFFDLQDMLGFDKASKTLDWLLTKSKKAIKELEKNVGAKSLSSTSTCEDESKNGDLEGIASKSKSLAGVTDEKKMNKLQKVAVNLVAKESRAKARARARERTRMKMCTKRLQESKKCPDSSPHILNQPRSLSQHQAYEKLSSYSHNMASSLKVVSHEAEEVSSHLLTNQVPKGNAIEESIVMKRKFKPSTIMGYQQNIVMLKDISCNNNNNNLANLPPNWDLNSAIARSTLFAITNKNLSAGLQIYGKLWEAENNHVNNNMVYEH